MKVDETENLEVEKVHVRVMSEKDLAQVIDIDSETNGFRREQHLTKKFNDSCKESGIVISLIAELNHQIVGFIMGDIYYGAFGRVEKSATISSLAVHPEFSRKGVATALLQQFLTNTKALHVNYVETLVDWEQNFDLMGFFRSAGFEPGKRVHLSLNLSD